MQHHMAEVTARGSRTISITFCEQPEGYTQTPEEQTQTYPGSQDDTGGLARKRWHGFYRLSPKDL